MQTILRQSNQDLLQEIDRLISVLSMDPVPVELISYQEMVTDACRYLRQLVLKNLRDLEFNLDDTFIDILSQTQWVTRVFGLYNQRIASPLLRFRASDQLCLRIVTWLHDCHPQTKGVPAGLSDGEFGVWPEPKFPIIYFMPSSRQHGLLCLPLFFHEFGHLLYACHEQEMDPQVSELQDEIADLLEPVSQRNDRYARQATKKRKIIVETWYEWAQEIFCDAVGLTIGGPCFANAFSMYLRMTGSGQFHQPQERLALSGHPVAWLRVQLVAKRARQMKLAGANRIEAEWKQIAETMQISEDYYGFHDDRFLPAINEIIDTMLMQASPYRFTVEDISSFDKGIEAVSPVRLLNKAWFVFLNDPSSYARWEEQAISEFLDRWQ